MRKDDVWKLNFPSRKLLKGAIQQVRRTDLLTLNCARLRLTRWGQAVTIYEDPQMGKPDATSAEVRTVRDSLQQILLLFANTEKISGKGAAFSGFTGRSSVFV